MPVLPVTVTLAVEAPTVVLEHLDRVSNLHEGKVRLGL
jgi:hypothetical protein